MAANPNVVELAVSRTLRDSLERIQRTSEEVHQAVNDLVSAFASSTVPPTRCRRWFVRSLRPPHLFLLCSKCSPDL